MQNNITTELLTTKRFVAKVFLGTALSISLLACGGGGGGGGSIETSVGSGTGGVTPPAVVPPTTVPPVGSPPLVTPPALTPPVATPPALHPTLSGKLFFNAPFHFVEMDLKTGIERVLRPRDSSFTTSRDATEFVTTNRFGIRGAQVSDEELVIFDRDGLQKSRFLVDEGFGGRPEISPDKQFVLVEWHSTNLGDAGGVSVPTIFTRGGAIVKRFVGYGGYAWLPDGRILVAKDDSLYIISPTGSGVLASFSEPVF